ncbi:hypothetical protein B296_00029337 [Ensete ventricosum]|uniref:Uncharacterized protein n=1 Tax=Ensete ventricosum TaxID=4639 RepID=A0A426ZW18_ENSVE|nr:hypothetical protein B296_00029337 [Ensete ventricosum]
MASNPQSSGTQPFRPAVVGPAGPPQNFVPPMPMQFVTSYGPAPNGINVPSQFQPASMMQTPAHLGAQPWSMPGTQSMPLVTPLIQTAQLPAAAAVMAPVRISPIFRSPLFSCSLRKELHF